MGSWDCYCMLCCAPLKTRCVHVGDNRSRALKKRERMIRKREREEKGLEGAPGGDEMESTDEEGAEAKDDSNITDPAKPISDSNGQSELYHGDPANGMMYDYCEEWSYDPRLLIKKDVAWLDQCRTLGFNPQTRKTFMSGIGTYDDGGSFAVREAGTDPNDPHPGTGYPCYTPNGLEFDGITFPLHEACYSILAKRLGYDDPADINRDALFETVRPIGEGNNDSLCVDYGCELSHQYWENRPGKEYVVTCPEDGDLELRSTIWQRLPARLLLASPPFDLSRKVQHDPLSILPFDILHIILQHLSIHDYLSLMQASHHVCTITRESTLWRSMIRTHLAPWLWEIIDLVDGDELPGFDYKGLFLWLDKVTQPKFGMGGPFMGVANRRRIWGVCGQLVDAYKDQLNTMQDAEA